MYLPLKKIPNARMAKYSPSIIDYTLGSPKNDAPLTKHVIVIDPIIEILSDLGYDVEDIKLEEAVKQSPESEPKAKSFPVGEPKKIPRTRPYQKKERAQELNLEPLDEPDALRMEDKPSEESALDEFKEIEL